MRSRRVIVDWTLEHLLYCIVLQTWRISSIHIVAAQSQTSISEVVGSFGRNSTVIK